jgi:NAD(P)-dependent dehydrogenase (short-subunit alcohol dehydrogenase family)
VVEFVAEGNERLGKDPSPSGIFIGKASALLFTFRRLTGARRSPVPFQFRLARPASVMTSPTTISGEKLLVMTGGSGGFGRRALERLLRERPEWRIALLARISAKTDTLLALPEARDRLTVIDTDLASLASVERAGDAAITWLAGRKADALAFNAGVQALLGDQETVDGIELSFAVNHLAHYDLAERLLPYMAAGGRIVITSSEVHDPEAFCLVGITRAVWQDPRELADTRLAQGQYTERVDRGEARYCASKLMNLMHVRHLAKTHPGINAVAFNPSVVPGTDIARERNILQILGWKYIMPILAPVLPGVRSIAKSGGDLFWLIADADARALNGQYVDGRQPLPGSAESRDPAKIKTVIAVSDALLREGRARNHPGGTAKILPGDAA